MFPMDLSRGWYITTNGTPCSTFVLWMTLLVSVFMSFCGYLFCENHDLILQRYFSKSFSSEQIRLSLRDWL